MAKWSSDPGLQVSSLTQKLVAGWLGWMPEMPLQLTLHSTGPPRSRAPLQLVAWPLKSVCYQWTAAPLIPIPQGKSPRKSRKQAGKCCIACPVPTMGKEHSPATANLLNWVSKNMWAIARKSQLNSKAQPLLYLSFLFSEWSREEEESG